MNNTMSNTKSTTIMEFVELANAEGKSVIPLAKQHLKLLNSKNKIGSLLNECGYQYDSKAKQWYQVVSKGITQSMTFEDFVTSNNLLDRFKFRGLEAPTEKVNQQSTQQFTDDEVKFIREIIQLYGRKAEETVATTNETTEETIEDAINRLGRSAKNVRKTFVIDAKIAEAFQSFCDERSLKYSDVISVAIKKIIDNY